MPLPARACRPLSRVTDTCQCREEAAAAAVVTVIEGTATKDRVRQRKVQTAQSKGPTARRVFHRYIQAGPAHRWRQRHHQGARVTKATQAALAQSQATLRQTSTLTKTRTKTGKRTKRAALRSTRPSWVHSPHAPWTPCGGWSGMASGASAGIELPQPLPLCRRHTRHQGTWAMHTRSGRGSAELPSWWRSLADGVES